MKKTKNLVLATLVLSACGPQIQVTSQSLPVRPPRQFQIAPLPQVIPLELEITSDECTDPNLCLIDAKVTKVYLSRSSFPSPTDRSIFQSEIETFAKELSWSDPHELKVELETKIEKKHGKAVVYNKDLSDPFSAYRMGGLQCYTGTRLFEFIRRNSNKVVKADEEVIERAFVIITTPGHVLPGYVIRAADQSLHLYGIETTAAGRAEIYFGPTKELDEAIRVIDSEHFAQMEAFRGKLKDSKETVRQSLQITANAYDIPLEKTEAHVAKHTLNSAFPLFFGTADVPAGNQERVLIIRKHYHENGTFRSLEKLRTPPKEKSIQTAELSQDSEIMVDSRNPFDNVKMVRLPKLRLKDLKSQVLGELAVQACSELDEKNLEYQPFAHPYKQYHSYWESTANGYQLYQPRHTAGAASHAVYGFIVQSLKEAGTVNGKRVLKTHYQPLFSNLAVAESELELQGVASAYVSNPGVSLQSFKHYFQLTAQNEDTAIALVTFCQPVRN